MKPKARHKLKTGQWNYTKYARHTTKLTMLQPEAGLVSMKQWRKWFRFGWPGLRIWKNGDWLFDSE